MGSFRKLFGTSKSLEVEGVEVDLGDGLKVRVARDNNPKARKLWQAKMKFHRAQLRNRNLPEDVMQRIGIEVMAEAVLLGWTNADDDGVAIDYSIENAVNMLTKYPDFRVSVAEISADMTLFQEEDEADARKNFDSTSAGSSSSAA